MTPSQGLQHLKEAVEMLYRLLPVFDGALDREDIFEAHALLEDVLRRQARKIEMEAVRAEEPAP